MHNLHRMPRLSLKKFLIFLLAALALILVVRLAGNLLNKDRTVENVGDIAVFLAEYGWEVKPEPATEKTVQIPKEFDEVYERYNDLQKKQGFDLSPHRAKTADSYSFEITNHPSGKIVFANVLVVDGKIIGGDICSFAMDGFMMGLDGETQY